MDLRRLAEMNDFISETDHQQPPESQAQRSTVVAVAAFLDAFQKVADLATNSRGSTRVRRRERSLCRSGLERVQTGGDADVLLAHYTRFISTRSFRERGNTREVQRRGGGVAQCSSELLRLIVWCHQTSSQSELLSTCCGNKHLAQVVSATTPPRQEAAQEGGHVTAPSPSVRESECEMPSGSWEL
ncbi:unnamed protein product [Pleuronectes platessa]|uniref:IMD domain-containing protein n=1 Tax=Pleuronectes platessa TaxID=8262 RepID=A0A9N7TXZ9_PLEPL|nr:unnamed protein product [Pleuronectes platessa]